MKQDRESLGTRKVIYAAMVILLIVIVVAARRDAHPIFLSVGLIGEIILVATAHPSSVIQQTARIRDVGNPR